MRDIASPFDGFASPFGPQRGFNPASLFGSTEGLWFNFADISSLYQDNLAATPLTAPDQSIGLAADRSRVRSPITTAAVAQSSLGLRPKWGRAPKVKRNLLTWTEDFTNGAWTKTGSSVVGRVVTESVAASTHGVSNSVSFAASPSPNTITARFKAGTGTRNIAIRGAGASGSAYAIFSPSTGGDVASGTTGA